MPMRVEVYNSICENTVYFVRNILTWHCVGSSILQRNSVYYMACLPKSVDLPSVFKIDKVQDQPVCARQSVCTHTSN